MKSILASLLEPRTNSIYPIGLKEICIGREKKALGNQFGLSQFGVNLVKLNPGAASSQRHWHLIEDEFVYILSGNITLITNEGEQVLGPGMCCGFKAGEPNAHQLINKSEEPVEYLEIGTRSQTDEATYPDVDLHAVKESGSFKFFHKDGTPYTE
ncbi:unnamed protein product [Blepharisma stoltei]|uniref:Cupin type-2 domain-containing protein n=1 Tax=Blepharisma stoltei TaxID=1481888 RepID=A0AAU9ILQ0_9CILI|nr:unnamed protein product [Blepharisma stoltei]